MAGRAPDDQFDTAIASEAFGQNAWLVEQMHRRFVEDPSTVSEVWREFFTGYRPVRPTSNAPAQREKPRPLEVLPPSTGAVEAPEPSVGVDLSDLPEHTVPAELKGSGAMIARRMEDSRSVPTATSVRTIPARLLEVNRTILNNQLKRGTEGGKVSFTHLIGWAIVKALSERAAMNAFYRDVQGKPYKIEYRHINLGLAMDLARRDGSRTLLVPNIKGADDMTFREFWLAYEDMVQRARAGTITPDDFADTTATLTNPGTVGTVQSVPRLMPGQGVIVGVGRIGFPPEYEGADPRTIASAGIGSTLTITSTYDHRIIQGAESGMFLGWIHELLLGEHAFYDEIFDSMRIPYVPARWAVDTNPPPGSKAWVEKQARVFQLINMYRVRGHLIADLDPLRQRPPSTHPELDPLSYELTLWDLDREFATGGLGGETRMKAGRILGVLRDAYCRSTGVEYMHIQEPDQKLWIQQHVEILPEPLGDEEKRRILSKLNEAESFEQFLHTKFLGAKRFSLQGAESLIPLLDTLLSGAAETGTEEVVIGMAHRGRLNVLANIVGKSLVTIFHEFGGVDEDVDTPFSGDVKYHLGATGVHKTASGTTVDVTLVANPSHLEAVDPVLEGMVRAKQDARGEGAEDLILPLLIHGDAAFSGQGVVAETLNLSQLPGYYTGGTIHVVVNNQVGFTTGSADARSSFYATDVAKAVQALIFHVNGDEPEAVVRVARIALAFRHAFHKDVVIDLVCYRRLGHNEGDEPTYTQPRMYQLINDRRSVRHLYLERLINAGDITLEEAEAVLENFRTLLAEALKEGKQPARPERRPQMLSPEASFDTRVPLEELQAIEANLRSIPEGFTVHPKLARTLDERYRLFAEGHTDWALAEALALGSLALEGIPIRLAGEDSQRGTFSHRHAVLVDYHTEQTHMPLRALHPDQAPVRVYDSSLSEFAAMGFEYGYTVGEPKALVMWEAQFGDFVNGAQVVIDQFLISGFDKWNQTSGLTLLLPHGFEGQGPEHSSARLERFLMNAAERNIRVAAPSTPAQYFHLLRRQAHHPAKRPLIVMTPKSLLRTRTSFSTLADLHDVGYQRVIADVHVSGKVRRVLLCTGKIYFDLMTYRDENNIDDVAIVRVEQLYPFPAEELNRVLGGYEGAELVWVQEEPANMGAWRFMSRYLFVEAGVSSRGIYRRESSSPATGNPRTHAREQRTLVESAFAR